MNIPPIYDALSANVLRNWLVNKYTRVISTTGAPFENIPSDRVAVVIYTSTCTKVCCNVTARSGTRLVSHAYNSGREARTRRAAVINCVFDAVKGVRRTVHSPLAVSNLSWRDRYRPYVPTLYTCVCDRITIIASVFIVIQVWDSVLAMF